MPGTTGRKLNAHFQLSAFIPAMLQSKGIIALLPSLTRPPTLKLFPLPRSSISSKPLRTPSPHPDLPSVGLPWHRLEEREGWADCTLGPGLILVSRLYLFSFLLPLYAASTSTARLVILNRPPTFLPRCPVSGLPLGSGGAGGRRKS